MKNNITRRNVLLGMGSAFAVGAISTAASAQTRTYLSDVPQQVKTAIRYLKENDAGRPQVILDKVNNKLYLVTGKGVIYSSFPVLRGKKRADDLDVNNPTTGITPAGFSGVKLAYNPLDDEKKKPGQVSARFLSNVVKDSYLAMHPTLNATSNEENISDDNSDNNLLSEGCIRIPREHHPELIQFLLTQNNGYRFYEDVTAQINAEKAKPEGQRRLLEFPVAARMNVLSELDPSIENVPKTLAKQMNCSFDTFAKGPEFCPAAG